MGKEAKKFTFLFADGLTESKSVEKDGILIGRLGTCDLVLDHTMVSRVHAGINFDHSDYELVNLSKKNTLMLNGSSLGPQKTDVLADGDTIQVGPFSISVSIKKDSISLMVQGRFATPLPEEPAATKPPVKQARSGDAAGVLGAFWGKRNRSKEDWGTRLRPTEEPIPGKAMFNWRPTKDLRRPWRFGLFIWAFLLVGAIGAFAYFRYPTVYEPKPLSNPHASKIENTGRLNLSVAEISERPLHRQDLLGRRNELRDRIRGRARRHGNGRRLWSVRNDGSQQTVIRFGIYL